jgi:hypothetical protein
MATKLNQVVAVVSGQKGEAEKAPDRRATTPSRRATCSPACPGTYTPRNADDADTRSRPSARTPSMSVGYLYASVAAVLAKCWDSVATQDWAQLRRPGRRGRGRRDPARRGPGHRTCLFLEHKLKDTADPSSRRCRPATGADQLGVRAGTPTCLRLARRPQGQRPRRSTRPSSSTTPPTSTRPRPSSSSRGPGRRVLERAEVLDGHQRPGQGDDAGQGDEIGRGRQVGPRGGELRRRGEEGGGRQGAELCFRGHAWCLGVPKEPLFRVQTEGQSQP